MTNIIGSSNPFQTRIQTFDSSPLSATTASRTVTALPGGALAVDDTFARRTILPGQSWMQSIGSAGPAVGLDPQAAAQAAPSAAPAKRKKKKRGLKKLAKKVKRFAKGGIKQLRSIVKKPLQFVKQALGIFPNPAQLLGGGLPRA